MAKEGQDLRWVGQYTLDEKGNPVKCTDIRQWEKFLQSKRKIIEQTVVANGRWISTVFLGLDHNFYDAGDPILFETMVFPEKGNYADLYCKRYSTLDQAKRRPRKSRENGGRR